MIVRLVGHEGWPGPGGYVRHGCAPWHVGTALDVDVDEAARLLSQFPGLFVAVSAAVEPTPPPPVATPKPRRR